MLKKGLDVKTIKEVEYQIKDFYTRYGVIENKYYIDYMIDKLSKVKTNKMEIYVKTLLRMGIYQIMFLKFEVKFAHTI